MITANDLKVKGIKIIDEQIKEEDEVLIAYRGKPKYIFRNGKRVDRGALKITAKLIKKIHL